MAPTRPLRTYKGKKVPARRTVFFQESSFDRLIGEGRRNPFDSSSDESSDESFFSSKLSCKLYDSSISKSSTPSVSIKKVAKYVTEKKIDDFDELLNTHCIRKDNFSAYLHGEINLNTFLNTNNSSGTAVASSTPLYKKRKSIRKSVLPAASPIEKTFRDSFLDRFMGLDLNKSDVFLPKDCKGLPSKSEISPEQLPTIKDLDKSSTTSTDAELPRDSCLSPIPCLPSRDVECQEVSTQQPEESLSFTEVKKKTSDADASIPLSGINSTFDERMAEIMEDLNEFRMRPSSPLLPEKFKQTIFNISTTSSDTDSPSQEHCNIVVPGTPEDSLCQSPSSLPLCSTGSKFRITLSESKMKTLRKQYGESNTPFGATPQRPLAEFKVYSKELVFPKDSVDSPPIGVCTRSRVRRRREVLSGHTTTPGESGLGQNNLKSPDENSPFMGAHSGLHTVPLPQRVLLHETSKSSFCTLSPAQTYRRKSSPAECMARSVSPLSDSEVPPTSRQKTDFGLCRQGSDPSFNCTPHSRRTFGEPYEMSPFRGFSESSLLFRGFNEPSITFQNFSETPSRSRKSLSCIETSASSLPVLLEDNTTIQPGEQDSGSPSESGQESPQTPSSASNNSLAESPLALRRQDSKESEYSDVSSSEDEGSTGRNVELNPLRRSGRQWQRTSQPASLGFITEESEFDAAVSEQDHLPTSEERLWLMNSKKLRRSLSIIHALRDVETSFNNSNVGDKTSIIGERGSKYQETVNKLVQMQGRNERRVWQSLFRPSGVSPMQRRSSVVAPRVSKAVLRRSSIMPIAESPHRAWSPVLTNIQRVTPIRGSLEPFIEEEVNESSAELEEKSVIECPSSEPTTPVNSSPLDDSSESPISHQDAFKWLSGQTEYCSFDDVFGDSRTAAKKIGEGVFGEVFFVERNSEKSVLKVIPVEGNFTVNGEPQKTYNELLTELLVSIMLSDLSDSENKPLACSGFVKIRKSWLICGRYPPWLLQMWLDFDEQQGSENQNPKMFPQEQLYVGFELAHCGQDLESYKFSSAKQGLSAFKQVVYSLAVAEEFQFEHRDLHWGNVLISRTAEKSLVFCRDEHTFKMNPSGVKATIIDYTLSSMTIQGCRYFNDLSKDPEIFLGKGDYQFDVYRQMKSDVEGDWSKYCPKTNVRWLYYLADKLIEMAHYQRKSAGVHFSSLKVLRDIRSWIRDCNSALEVALKLKQ